jgi:hypothetical protein
MGSHVQDAPRSATLLVASLPGCSERCAMASADLRVNGRHERLVSQCSPMYLDGSGPSSAIELQRREVQYAIDLAAGFK